jgi:hypothetical protein
MFDEMENAKIAYWLECLLPWWRFWALPKSTRPVDNTTLPQSTDSDSLFAAWTWPRWAAFSAMVNWWINIQVRVEYMPIRTRLLLNVSVCFYPASMSHLTHNKRILRSSTSRKSQWYWHSGWNHSWTLSVACYLFHFGSNLSRIGNRSKSFRISHFNKRSDDFFQVNSVNCFGRQLVCRFGQSRLCGSVCTELGNHAVIPAISQQFEGDFTVWNVIDKVIPLSKLGVCCEDVVPFIASHLYEIPSIAFECVSDFVLESILSHSDLKTASDDSLYEIVTSWIRENSTSLNLLEFVKFEECRLRIPQRIVPVRHAFYDQWN